MATTAMSRSSVAIELSAPSAVIDCVAARTVHTTALMPSDTSTSRPANVRVSHTHARRTNSPDVTGSSAACGRIARPSLRLQLLSEYARPS